MPCTILGKRALISGAADRAASGGLNERFAVGLSGANTVPSLLAFVGKVLPAPARFRAFVCSYSESALRHNTFLLAVLVCRHSQRGTPKRTSSPSELQARIRPRAAVVLLPSTSNPPRSQRRCAEWVAASTYCAARPLLLSSSQWYG
jgi:hypothetical protein